MWSFGRVLKGLSFRKSGNPDFRGNLAKPDFLNRGWSAAKMGKNHFFSKSDFPPYFLGLCTAFYQRSPSGTKAAHKPKKIPLFSKKKWFNTVFAYRILFSLELPRLAACPKSRKRGW